MSERIVIVGGGPVGLAFALAAQRLRDVDVTVVERNAAATELPAIFDHRVYALSRGSLDFLRELGAAPPAARVAPVDAMQVWGDDGESRVGFAGGEPLAAIVEHAAVMHALETRVLADGRVRMLRGQSPAGLCTGTDGSRGVRLASGEILAADLIIAADGSRSQLREWEGIATTRKDYESDGLVANFTIARSHGDVARQWFLADSVLAWLPLPGNMISIVWSLARETAARTAEMAPAALARAVAQAGSEALGDLTLASPVACFPLARVFANEWARPGLALMGDAAHAVHPLAGQGVNLGFADARAMHDVLARRSRFSAVGDLRVLRQYERSRREAAFAVGEVTDRLRALYLSDAANARWLRNRGLGIVDGLPGVKSLLVDYAAH